MVYIIDRGMRFMLLYYSVILVAILALFFQANVTNTFGKYSKIRSSKGYTGADVARMLLSQNGITDVSVQPIRGNLTDHYNPVNKTLNLSESVYNSTSVAALGVAAHETGHAVQHAKGYIPLLMRSAIFPAVSFSSKIAMPLFIFGILLTNFINSPILALIGAWLYVFVVVFQIITLPVEFNASSRALKMLRDYNFLDETEVGGAKKVLSAAAMTYVAAAAASILQFLRLLAIANSRRDR